MLGITTGEISALGITSGHAKTGRECYHWRVGRSNSLPLISKSTQARHGWVNQHILVVNSATGDGDINEILVLVNVVELGDPVVGEIALDRAGSASGLLG